jgi:polysaccharide export outer membrane protein
MRRFAAVVLACWGVGTAMGCAHSLPFVWVDDLPPAALVPDPYRIAAGDSLSILVWNQSKLSGDVRVRTDGQVTLPLIGDVAVGGLTPTGAASQVQHRLDGLVVDPKVTVSIRESATPTFSVVGEIKTSGSYPLNGPTTLLQAIAAAGGLTEFSNRDRIFVIRKGPEIKRIRFTYEKLSRVDGRGILFQLREGDIVVIE